MDGLEGRVASRDGWLMWMVGLEGWVAKPDGWVSRLEGWVAKEEGWLAKLEGWVAKMKARPLATAALCVGSSTTLPLTIINGRHKQRVANAL